MAEQLKERSLYGPTGWQPEKVWQGPNYLDRLQAECMQQTGFPMQIVCSGDRRYNVLLTTDPASNGHHPDVIATYLELIARPELKALRVADIGLVGDLGKLVGYTQTLGILRPEEIGELTTWAHYRRIEVRGQHLSQASPAYRRGHPDEISLWKGEIQESVDRLGKGGLPTNDALGEILYGRIIGRVLGDLVESYYRPVDKLAKVK